MKNVDIITEYKRLKKKYNAESIDELKRKVPHLYYLKRMEYNFHKENGMDSSSIKVEADAILQDQKTLEIMEFFDRLF